jgi:hypothetical protein
LQACCPKTGEELTISYGDKGNEELLLLYGFALPANPHETLMLLCPLPPAEDWDDVFSARMQLLQVCGACYHPNHIVMPAMWGFSAATVGTMVNALCNGALSYSLKPPK